MFMPDAPGGNKNGEWISPFAVRELKSQIRDLEF
jgi:hypothetical protein